MSTLQTEWSEHELLESHDYAEPLLVGGVRCHGGFDENGDYRSPRTRHRPDAIAAWEAVRQERFATPALDMALDSWPPHYPNVAQSRHLIREGVIEPIVAALTRIGTVEGFGAMIRNTPLPRFQECFVEDVRGTTMAHLQGGLFEAHARDEAGFEDEGGHRQMWFAARDIAFESPLTEDQTELMLARMGISGYGAGPSTPRVRPEPVRQLDDVDAELEGLVTRMARLLLIEISAFHTFAWAEELLSDTDLVAGNGGAGSLVSCIRADEASHVAYLATVLSEMRDRTVVGESGRRRPGTDVVGRIWDRARGDSLGPNQAAGRRQTLGEIDHALEGHPRRSDILARFHELDTPASATGERP